MSRTRFQSIHPQAQLLHVAVKVLQLQAGRAEAGLLVYELFQLAGEAGTGLAAPAEGAAQQGGQLVLAGPGEAARGTGQHHAHACATVEQVPGRHQPSATVVAGTDRHQHGALAQVATQAHARQLGEV